MPLPPNVTPEQLLAWIMEAEDVELDAPLLEAMEREERRKRPAPEAE